MPGTQKVTFGRNSDTDYKSKLAAAKAQAGANSYIQGVQAGIGGVGDAISSDRNSQYANSNVALGDLLDPGGFSYTDSPGNQPLNNRMHQTGSADTQASSTTNAQQDPSVVEEEALMNTQKLEGRLAKMAAGGQGFPGLNNRNYEV